MAHKSGHARYQVSGLVASKGVHEPKRFDQNSGQKGIEESSMEKYNEKYK